VVLKPALELPDRDQPPPPDAHDAQLRHDVGLEEVDAHAERLGRLLLRKRKARGAALGAAGWRSGPRGRGMPRTVPQRLGG